MWNAESKMWQDILILYCLCLDTPNRLDLVLPLYWRWWWTRNGSYATLLYFEGTLWVINRFQWWLDAFRCSDVRTWFLENDWTVITRMQLNICSSTTADNFKPFNFQQNTNWTVRLTGISHEPNDRILYVFHFTEYGWIIITHKQYASAKSARTPTRVHTYAHIHTVHLPTFDPFHIPVYLTRETLIR